MAAGSKRVASTAPGKTASAKAATARKPGARKSAPNKRINLAFQGGGAHGAFTWGVCDRLLEQPGLEFEGVTATSAGAMNAAVLAHGLATDGREGAQAALADFWRRVSELGLFSPYQRTPLDQMTGNWSLDNSPAFVALDLLSRIASPYQLNPANLNPLRGVLEATIDFDILRHASGTKLFICATNVRSGKIRVFRNAELSADALLASACLPFLSQAVEVDGEAYWDGGFMGNPALYPVFYACECSDVLLVQINPLYREEVPTTARGILNRLNEITFNASLLREMRAIHFVTRMIDAGHLDPQHYKKVRVHMIACDDELTKVTSSSKLNVEWAFLTHLHDIGWRAADRWLSENFESIGVASTVDLSEVFM